MIGSTRQLVADWYNRGIDLLHAWRLQEALTEAEENFRRLNSGVGGLP